MNEITTLQNPFTIIFEHELTKVQYFLVFDDITGTITFKTEDAMYDILDYVYFNNSNMSSILRQDINISETDVLASEYLIFLSKLENLFKRTGDVGYNFFKETMYLKNKAISDSMIQAFCKAYAYNFDELNQVLRDKLKFITTDVPYANWLVDKKSIICTPINCQLELGDGMFNVVLPDTNIVTRILVKNKQDRVVINFFDNICQLTSNYGEELYNLVKTLYAQILPIAIGDIYNKLNIHNTVDNSTKKILLNQIDKFTENMIKIHFCS